TDVAVSGAHACASLADGTVWCWGSNDRYQLGDGTTTTRPTPVLVEGVTGATSVTVGLDRSCARLHDGTAKCWGSNDSFGLLGGGTDDATATISQVRGLDSIAALKAGEMFSCALLESGTAACWGRGIDAQVNSADHVASLTPIEVPGSSNVAEIALGDRFGCA